MNGEGAFPFLFSMRWRDSTVDTNEKRRIRAFWISRIAERIKKTVRGRQCLSKQQLMLDGISVAERGFFISKASFFERLLLTAFSLLERSGRAVVMISCPKTKLQLRWMDEHLTTLSNSDVPYRHLITILLNGIKSLLRLWRFAAGPAGNSGFSYVVEQKTEHDTDHKILYT